jgi:formylglycine-generating enzyme required for sulfatase activity
VVLLVGLASSCGKRERSPVTSSAAAAELEEQRRAEMAHARGRILQERAAATTDMEVVAAGRYRIGDNSLKDCPERVFETAGFLIDRYEVSNLKYRDFVEATSATLPRNWVEKLEDGMYREGIPPGKENHPVTTISYHDAAAYAAWAGKRLPTAAEWEVAARGPESLKYPWGDEYLAGRANDENAGLGGTSAVDSFSEGKSSFGCLNLSGNVEEWTMTEFSRTTQRDERIIKGGAYLDSSFAILPAMWKPIRAAVDGHDSIGFRCLKDLE